MKSRLGVSADRRTRGQPRLPKRRLHNTPCGLGACSRHSGPKTGHRQIRSTFRRDLTAKVRDHTDGRFRVRWIYERGWPFDTRQLTARSVHKRHPGASPPPVDTQEKTHATFRATGRCRRDSICEASSPAPAPSPQP